MRVRLLNASADAKGTSLPGQAVVDVDDKIIVKLPVYNDDGRQQYDANGKAVYEEKTLPQHMIDSRQAVEVDPETPLKGIRPNRDAEMEVEGRRIETADIEAPEDQSFRRRRAK